MADSAKRESLTLEFERTLEATCDEVFAAWTEPEQMREWWDPTGVPLVECTIDARVGGAFRFVTAGHAPPFQGVYSVFQRPALLEFDALGAHGTVALTPHEKGTAMKVSIRCASAEHFDMFVKLGVQQGTSVTLDNLVAHVR